MHSIYFGQRLTGVTVSLFERVNHSSCENLKPSSCLHLLKLIHVPRDLCFTGYLHDKSSLPVNMLQFNSDAKDSFFTLGPLECFGTGGRAPEEIGRASCRERV